MKNQDTLMSSDRMDWETPPELFDKLNRIFGFTVDVCADKNNKKCRRFFNKKKEALSLDWSKTGPYENDGRRVCWMNPPYGKGESKCTKSCKKDVCKKRGHHIKKRIPGLIDWVKKAKEQSERGLVVVVLVPARTDTKWFKIMWEAEALVFLPGRIQFVGAPSGAPSGAPFPSVIGVFGRGLSKNEIDKLGELGKVVRP